MIKKICILYAVLLAVVLLRPTELIEAKQRPLPKKIVLNMKSIKMHVGDTNMLTVKSIKPRKASKDVKWNSKNKKIASITQKGKVKAKKVGTTIIIARSVKNKEIKAKVKVVVKEKNINLPGTTSQSPVQPQQEQTSQQKEPEQPQNQIQQNELKEPDDKAEKECNYTASAYKDIRWMENVSGDGSVLKDAYTILFGEDARRKNAQENSCIISMQEEWTALAAQLQEVKDASGTDFVKRYFNYYENTDFTKHSLVVLPFMTQPYYSEHKVASVRTRLDANGKLCGEIIAECIDTSEPDMLYPAVIDECLFIIQLEKSDAEMIDYYVVKEKIGAKACSFQGNVYPEDGNDFSSVYSVLEKTIASQSEFTIINTKEEWTSIMSEVKAAVGQEAAAGYFKAYDDTDFDRKSIILHKLPTSTYYGGYKVAGLETSLDEQGKCHGQITIEREDLQKKYPDMAFTDNMVNRMVILQLNKFDAEMIDTFDLILKTVEVVEKVEKDCTFQASAYYLEQWEQGAKERLDFLKIYDKLESNVDWGIGGYVIDTREDWDAFMSQLKVEVGEEVVKSYFEMYENTDFSRQSVVLTPYAIYYREYPYLDGFEVKSVRTVLDEEGRLKCEYVTDGILNKEPEFSSASPYSSMAILQLDKSDVKMIDYFSTVNEAHE